MAASATRSLGAAKNRRVALAYNSATALVAPEDCDRVVRRAEAARSLWKKLLEGPAPDTPWRVAVGDLSDADDDIGWLPARLRELGASLNRQIWQFDITGWSEVLIIRYDIGQALPQHSDLNEDLCDYKITMLLQLSAGEAYVGGDLEFGTPPDVAARGQGTLLAFPAWMPHRVTAITKGSRYVAAVRALGPSFR